MTKTAAELKGFEFEYDNNASESFLVIKVKNSNHIFEYQALMISYNNVSHIIPFEARYNNDDCYCYYNITSKLPLITYLKRRKLKRNEFIGILSDLAGTVVNCSGYLLTASGFLLKTAHMFINPATLDLQLVYLPFRREIDVSAEFRDFVIDLILNHAVLDEDDNDNFLQRILSFVRNDFFNISEFYLFLNALNNTQKREAEDVTVKYTGDTESCEISESEVNTCHLVQDNKERKNSDRKLELNEAESRINVPLFVAVFVMQIVIAAALIICSSFLRQAGNSGFTTYAALILIAIAVEFLIFKKFFSIGFIRMTAKIKDEITNAKIASEDALINQKEPENIIEAGINAAGGNDNRNYNTVMLSPDMREPPCLIEKYNTQMKKIVINKPEFLIGRLEGQVDYVSENSAIGKIHACIAARNEGCCLIDLNSVNGTFINGSRIDSNKEYVIKNNDVISFANSEYIYLF